MTAITTAWAGYKGTVVRDDASSAATQGSAARDAHFNCRQYLSKLKGACN